VKFPKRGKRQKRVRVGLEVLQSVAESSARSSETSQTSTDTANLNKANADFNKSNANKKDLSIETNIPGTITTNLPGTLTTESEAELGSLSPTALKIHTAKQPPEVIKYGAEVVKSHFENKPKGTHRHESWKSAGKSFGRIARSGPGSPTASRLEAMSPKNQMTNRRPSPNFSKVPRHDAAGELAGMQKKKEFCFDNDIRKFLKVVKSREPMTPAEKKREQMKRMRRSRFRLCSEVEADLYGKPGLLYHTGSLGNDVNGSPLLGNDNDYGGRRLSAALEAFDRGGKHGGDREEAQNGPTGDHASERIPMMSDSMSVAQGTGMAQARGVPDFNDNNFQTVNIDDIRIDQFDPKEGTHQQELPLTTPQLTQAAGTRRGGAQVSFSGAVPGGATGKGGDHRGAANQTVNQGDSEADADMSFRYVSPFADIKEMRDRMIGTALGQDGHGDHASAHFHKHPSAKFLEAICSSDEFPEDVEDSDVGESQDSERSEAKKRKMRKKKERKIKMENVALENADKLVFSKRRLKVATRADSRKKLVRRTHLMEGLLRHLNFMLGSEDFTRSLFGGNHDLTNAPPIVPYVSVIAAEDYWSVGKRDRKGYGAYAKEDSEESDEEVGDGYRGPRGGPGVYGAQVDRDQDVKNQNRNRDVKNQDFTSQLLNSTAVTADQVVTQRQIAARKRKLDRKAREIQEKLNLLNNRYPGAATRLGKTGRNQAGGSSSTEEGSASQYRFGGDMNLVGNLGPNAIRFDMLSKAIIKTKSSAKQAKQRRNVKDTEQINAMLETSGHSSDSDVSTDDPEHESAKRILKQQMKLSAMGRTPSGILNISDSDEDAPGGVVSRKIDRFRVPLNKTLATTKIVRDHDAQATRDAINAARRGHYGGNHEGSHNASTGSNFEGQHKASGSGSGSASASGSSSGSEQSATGTGSASGSASGTETASASASGSESRQTGSEIESHTRSSRSHTRSSQSHTRSSQSQRTQGTASSSSASITTKRAEALLTKPSELLSAMNQNAKVLKRTRFDIDEERAALTRRQAEKERWMQKLRKAEGEEKDFLLSSAMSPLLGSAAVTVSGEAGDGIHGRWDGKADGKAQADGTKAGGKLSGGKLDDESSNESLESLDSVDEEVERFLNYDPEVDARDYDSDEASVISSTGLQSDDEIVNSNTIRVDKTLLNVYFQLPKQVADLMIGRENESATTRSKQNINQNSSMKQNPTTRPGPSNFKQNGNPSSFSSTLKSQLQAAVESYLVHAKVDNREQKLRKQKEIEFQNQKRKFAKKSRGLYGRAYSAYDDDYNTVDGRTMYKADQLPFGEFSQKELGRALGRRGGRWKEVWDAESSSSEERSGSEDGGSEDGRDGKPDVSKPGSHLQNTDDRNDDSQWWENDDWCRENVEYSHKRAKMDAELENLQNKLEDLQEESKMAMDEQRRFEQEKKAIRVERKRRREMDKLREAERLRRRAENSGMEEDYGEGKEWERYEEERKRNLDEEKRQLKILKDRIAKRHKDQVLGKMRGAVRRVQMVVEKVRGRDLKMYDKEEEAL